jgi:HSP20 family protein
MEMDKLKKWLDMAQQYQAESFWKQIFDEKNANPSSAPLTNPFSKAQEYFPKCDLYEADGRLVVEIEIPGLNKDDVHVSLNQQILTITGEFKSLEPKRKYFLKERANRRFKKELTLPFPVLLKNSSSELCNGVLAIYLPLNQEEIEDIPILFDEQTPE